MFTTTFSGELINVALRQLGATRIVETRNGIMYKVEFKLSDDLTVTYVFDVTTSIISSASRRIRSRTAILRARTR